MEGWQNYILDSYNRINKVIISHTKKGLLSSDYNLPNSKSFNNQVDKLFPVYKYFLKRQWEPQIVFYPKGFTINQWNNLLKGSPLIEGNKSEGVCQTWRGSEQKTRHVEWNLCIICSSSIPPVMDVSPNGKYGANADEAIRLLSHIPIIASMDLSRAAVIDKTSPSEEMYFTLQLYQFLLGKSPIDADTWSIGKQNIIKGESIDSLFFDWCLCGRRVFSYRFESSFYGNLVGIRPAVNGPDLL